MAWATAFVIKVRLTITDEKMIADFTGTSPQAPGPINLGEAGLVTAARCVFKAVTNTEIPANGGCFRALDIICPKGTILTAQSPAPVSIYYETKLAAMETMWMALAPIMPDKLPAGHQRTVGGTFISGIHPDTGRLFVMGEPLVGGWGAGHDRDGDAGQFCCANGKPSTFPSNSPKAAMASNRSVRASRRRRRRRGIPGRQGRRARLPDHLGRGVPDLFGNPHPVASVGPCRGTAGIVQPRRSAARRRFGRSLFDGHRHSRAAGRAFRLVSATGADTATPRGARPNG
jgi:hypothetical protein